MTGEGFVRRLRDEGGKMLRKTQRLVVSLAAIFLLCPVLAISEEPAQATTRKSATAQSQKPAITDAVRVSTDTALPSAAKHEAKKSADETATKSSSEADALELHPAAPNSAPAGNAVVLPRNSKKGPLKDIHGTVFGTTSSGDSGTRGTGGAVGASSKGGKASIYVETERSRTTPPR
jgi:hypothetical protein